MAKKYVDAYFKITIRIHQNSEHDISIPIQGVLVTLEMCQWIGFKKYRLSAFF